MLDNPVFWGVVIILMLGLALALILWYGNARQEKRRNKEAEDAERLRLEEQARISHGEARFATRNSLERNGHETPKYGTTYDHFPMSVAHTAALTNNGSSGGGD